MTLDSLINHKSDDEAPKNEQMLKKEVAQTNTNVSLYQ